MVILAIIHLLRWVMMQFGGIQLYSNSIDITLGNELTRTIIGLPLWLIFWRWAQRLFDGPREEERASTLRKFYLYGAIFFSFYLYGLLQKK